MWINLFIAFAGLAGGVAVGTGFVAFLSVLGILPRLMQLTKTEGQMKAYEWAIVSGTLFSTWASFRPFPMGGPDWINLPVGLLAGIFIGMLAAALTEVLNVFPLLAKRIGLDGQIIWLLMALVFGKIAGSLFHWLIFIH
ncbi:stage V sporulation protein AB [Bacillaceae bacterium SIJ1]|uniref:stage V sporulation protein AB n=1 Tax=Litoribacterium kuwaitense TaxID=1398745 RepID=UPI0013EBB2C2|nr:stage V sporulation protein AB [Litoribacterium kuwaitense]NGP43651.1 stage V sporulation protein AB [Litoribacterium kuwaitense]